MVLLSLLVVLLAGAVAALATGRIGAGMSVAMPEPVRTTGHDVLGPGAVGRADLAAVRFDRAARGYRMDQVDAVLDRLGEELAARDERIAALTAGADADAWTQEDSAAPSVDADQPAPTAGLPEGRTQPSGEDGDRR